MQAFPCGLKLKCWRTSTPSPPGCPAPSSRFQPRMKSSSESGCVLSLETAECPEPLCPWLALPAHGATSRVASEDITPPSSLIRAHASDQVPPGASVVPRTSGPCRLSPVPAGGWPFPTLSLQSLRRRLDPYPAASLECTCPFLPREHRPHATEDAFGTRNCPCNATSTGSRISGLQSFVYLQAPTLARPPDCIHRSIFVLGGRAVYTTHRPGGYPFRDVASLRVRLGQLTRLDLHQLDCSLVGCSLPHPAPRQTASLRARDRVDGRHSRERVSREEAEEPLPRHRSLLRPTVEPLLPDVDDVKAARRQARGVPRNPVVGTVPPQLRHQHPMLLGNRRVAVHPAPAISGGQGPPEAVLRRLSLEHPAAGPGKSPVVREPQNVERAGWWESVTVLPRAPTTKRGRRNGTRRLFAGCIVSQSARGVSAARPTPGGRQIPARGQ